MLHGNIIITKGSETEDEFILRGVFQISRNDFYFNPDANFNPANVFHGCFADVKLSCRLTVPHGEDFCYTINDYATTIENICALQKLAHKPEAEEYVSIIQEALGKPQIKLCHTLFEKKQESAEEEQNSSTEASSTGTAVENLGPEFSMETWPVAERCQLQLQELLPTHDICPLPAYEEDRSPIPPRQYESKLRGTLVEVHMSFCYHHIKKSKKHIFNAIPRQLIVLRPPAALPNSPFKRQRISAGNSKGKSPIRR
ncbi:hypothetical protein PAXINDRAFT_17684 [Paxillus involutus ATCC 200175]|uniref:Uncharacterized protein n=1 Tax=Paxillus involutus ATCC 200175 TaxID=664439 RepID=A0A0C9TPZ4_PAXIN|nr:hypothetical protein PAXINDRAFT_17684 [Paxillus involutus ATCC 200175]